MAKSDYSLLEQVARGHSLIHCTSLHLDATTSTAMSTDATWYGGMTLPVPVKVVDVIFVPGEDISGADTNTFEVNLVNKGSDGTGTTELVSKSFTNGVDATAADTTSLGTLSNSNVAAGECLVAQYQKVGNGQDAPAGAIVVQWYPRA